MLPEIGNSSSRSVLGGNDGPRIGLAASDSKDEPNDGLPREKSELRAGPNNTVQVPEAVSEDLQIMKNARDSAIARIASTEKEMLGVKNALEAANARVAAAEERAELAQVQSVLCSTFLRVRIYYMLLIMCRPKP